MKKVSEYHHPDLECLIEAAEREKDWRLWINPKATLFRVLEDRERQRNEPDLGL